MMWAFSWDTYKVDPGSPHTSIWRPLWDSINLCMSSNPSLSPLLVLTHPGVSSQGTLSSKLAQRLRILRAVLAADPRARLPRGTSCRRSAWRVIPQRRCEQQGGAALGYALFLYEHPNTTTQRDCPGPGPRSVGAASILSICR